MNKPNAAQKLIHRFATLLPVTGFFAPRMHQLDNRLYR